MKDLQKQQISASSELESAKSAEEAAQKALDDYIAAHGSSGNTGSGTDEMCIRDRYNIAHHQNGKKRLHSLSSPFSWSEKYRPPE